MRFGSLVKSVAAGLLGLACAQQATAATFTTNFESVPGATNAQGLAIHDQYLASQDMSFEYTDGSLPLLAAMKGTLKTEEQPAHPFAFWGPPGDGSADHPANAADVGNWIVTHSFGSTPPPLVVSYSSAMQSAGGEILDIDYGDAWRIDAMNHTGGIIGTLTLDTTNPFAGDGMATPWSFSSLGTDIWSVEITYTGTSHGGVGEGMDNFTATTAHDNNADSIIVQRPIAVPLPPAAVMALVMLMGVVGLKMVRREPGVQAI